MNAVIYASKGGNTKKIADAIAKALDVNARSVKETNGVDGIDTLFVGASIYAGGIDGSLKNFLQGLKSGSVKQIAVFGTAMTDKSAWKQIAEILKPAGIEIVNEFFQCKGAFLFSNKGRPNTDDLQSAASFAKRLTKV
ncbi:MAG: flavodoxin [Clostridiales bacterium]|jgi:menaquinone-dependent protoporphyrinogen IX oxidase|nr:flavodoxin [Clostridiales bacterium]